MEAPPLFHPEQLTCLCQVKGEMNGFPLGSLPATNEGCPISRAFFARCGIPRTLTFAATRAENLQAESFVYWRACDFFGMAIFLGHSYPVPKYELSSRPKRIRIFCHTALDKSPCAPFRKERRMKFAEATKPDRKYGGAKWRDLRFGLSASNAHGSGTLPFVIPSGRWAAGRLRPT